jgi:glycopeptide antibiotics resistance protein
MREQIAEYVVSLYKNIPMAVYEGLLSVLCLGVVVIIVCYGLKRGWRKIAGLILVGYVFVIYCSTVLFRTAADGNGHEFRPFWSYDAIENGRSELLAENMMNVIVFVPVGVMLGCAFRSMTWWKVLLIGCGISVSIEAMQYIFHRGFAETDDVMHNTLGCVIGYGLYSLIRMLYDKFSKRCMAIL